MKGYVKYDTVIEDNRDALRVKNHAMGFFLVERIVPCIRDCERNGTGSELWVDGHSFVAVCEA